MSADQRRGYRSGFSDAFKESAETVRELSRANEALRADLARALPVVEAAGALESFIDKHPIDAERYFTFESKLETLIDALARAVKGEPG